MVGAIIKACVVSPFRERLRPMRTKRELLIDFFHPLITPPIFHIYNAIQDKAAFGQEEDFVLVLLVGLWMPGDQ